MNSMTELQTKEHLQIPPLDPFQVFCFVCIGNTCRSPMAEALFCYKAKKAGRPLRAVSAGIAANPGEPISEQAIRALQRFGVTSSPDNDYRSHRARQIDRSLIERCDRIITLCKEYLPPLLHAFPEFSSKFECFGSDVADPYGGTDADYERALQQIDAEFRQRFFHE